MYIVAGSLMFTLGLVAVSLLAWMLRRRELPRWLGADLTAMLLCIPVTTLIGLGLGYVFIGLSHGVGIVQVSALLGSGAVLWGVVRLLRRHLPAPVVVGTAGVGLSGKRLPPAS